MPMVEPGTQCPNPASRTNYQCVRFNTAITSMDAVNGGQWRADFHVVEAGSNGIPALSLFFTILTNI